METLFMLASLVALIVALVASVFKRRSSSNDETDLDTVACFIYELDDPDVLKELSILNDIRRLLLHLELTEGHPRLG